MFQISYIIIQGMLSDKDISSIDRAFFRLWEMVPKFFCTSVEHNTTMHTYNYSSQVQTMCPPEEGNGLNVWAGRVGVSYVTQLDLSKGAWGSLFQCLYYLSRPCCLTLVLYIPKRSSPGSLFALYFSRLRVTCVWANPIRVFVSIIP